MMGSFLRLPASQQDRPATGAAWRVSAIPDPETNARGTLTRADATLAPTSNGDSRSTDCRQGPDRRRYGAESTWQSVWHIRRERSRTPEFRRGYRPPPQDPGWRQGAA